MPTNFERAGWAGAALRHFQSSTGTDDDTALPDILCDLQHWANREGVSFENALDTARMHHQAECAEQEANDQQAMLPQAVQDLIDAFEEQTESARAVVESWAKGDLAGAVHGLEMSLDESAAALAKVKGGAA
jgi:hypothetical protein